MGALPTWQCFLGCPDEASAAPVAEYLRLHGCPALVFPVPASCEFTPTAHIWTHAAASPTGSLSTLRPGSFPELRQNRSNRMRPPDNRCRGVMWGLAPRALAAVCAPGCHRALLRGPHR
jgi:hypothetical protein